MLAMEIFRELAGARRNRTKVGLKEAVCARVPAGHKEPQSNQGGIERRKGSGGMRIHRACRNRTKVGLKVASGPP